MVMSKGYILIVDDEELLRWVLQRKLSREGYICGEAGNAEEALQKMHHQLSDLVVLDIEMPGKPGTEVLPEIVEAFPQTAVVMASGVTDTSVIARCIRNGAADFVCKPYSLDEILLSITRALEKKRLEMQVAEYERELGKVAGGRATSMRQHFMEDIQTLIGTLEAADKYTAGHSYNVVEIALLIGQQLGLAGADMEDLRWGALLHDVGKIAVDPHILNKPATLTPDEYRHIMTHAIVGPSLIRPFVNESVVEIISHHHDHYDGSGVFQQVTGGEIPHLARIVTVADAFDAMTSARPYREAMSPQAALSELVRCSGSHFDPEVTRILLELANSPGKLPSAERETSQAV